MAAVATPSITPATSICGINMAGIATDSGKGQYSGAPEALVKSIG